MTKESPASLTPEERAREIGDPGDTLLHYIVAGHIRAAERAAEARGRERGIEEAARECERFAPGNMDADDCTYMAKACAKAIRALLSAEPKATPPSQPQDRQTDRQEMATSPLEKIGKP